MSNFPNLRRIAKWLWCITDVVHFIIITVNIVSTGNIIDIINNADTAI